MTKCIVTGAGGFVGSAVIRRLRETGRFSVGALVRRSVDIFPPDVSIHPGFDLAATANRDAILAGVHCVVHAAARVHVKHDSNANSLELFREVNVNGTLNFARQCAAAGVRRFVFLSSIKVNGEQTALGIPFRPDDPPAPLDPYGISKMEAEKGLRAITGQTGMELVIIRPPLVYGPGVKANFQAMMRWLSKGVPLPLGAIHNQRSLVALDNLVDLIVTCVEHPAAADRTFLVSDGEDLSTTQLLRRLSNALGKPTRLFPVPSWILAAGAAMFGKRSLFLRLCGNLQVDISETRSLLAWSPPVTVDDGLRAAATYYLVRQDAL